MLTDEFLESITERKLPPPAWAKPGIRTPDLQDCPGTCYDCDGGDAKTAHAHLCGHADHLTPADAWYCDACKIHWVCDDCLVSHDREEGLGS